MMCVRAFTMVGPREVTVVEYFLCAGHHFKCFAYGHLILSSQQPYEEVLLLPLFNGSGD